MKIRILQVSAIILLLSCVLNAQINYFGQSEFADIFGRTCHDMVNLPNEAINQPDVENAFRAIMIGQFEIPGYGVKEVFTIKQPAVIFNYGNRFEYAMYTQAIPPVFEERIFKELEDLKEDFYDEFDDINPDWSFADNKILITAKYIYNDASGGDIRERLLFLMKFSQDLVNAIITEDQMARIDRKHDLKDTDLEYLSRFDLNCLMPDEDFEDWAKEDPSTGEGAYGYSLNGIDVEIRNYGKSISLMWEGYLPGDINVEQENSLKDKLLEIANENKPEGDPELSVIIPEDSPQNIRTVATYTFNKSFSGDDFIDYFEDFMDDFINTIDSEYDDLKEDLTD